MPSPRRSRRPTRGSSSGFTLIEVLTVCAVVVVLAALALPAMESQLRRGKRNDAVAALTRVQQAQDSYQYQNGHYAAQLQLLGLSERSPQGLYTLQITAAGVDNYSATAAALAGSSQAKDGVCSALKLRVTPGGAEYGPDSACWNR